MSGKLVAEEGILKGLVITLEGKERWVLGSDPQACDFVLEDPSSDKQHLILRLLPEGILAENLSEDNPVTINQQELSSPRLLQDGDTLKIGDGLYRMETRGQEQLEDDPQEKGDKEEAESEKEDLEESAGKEDEEEKDLSSDSLDDDDTIFDEENEDDRELLADIDFDAIDIGRFLLKVVSGPNNGAEFSMKKGASYTIGSDPMSADIVLQDKSVSRKHASISITEENDLFLEDLSSKNGTFIEGEKIEEKQPLTENSVVTIGTTSFAVFDREGDMKTIISPLMPSIVKVLQKGEQKEQEESEQVGKKSLEEKTATANTQGKALLYSGIIALIALLLVAAASLFIVRPIEETEYVNTEAKIERVMQQFPAVQYSYNRNTGNLLLIGHVLTTTDRTQLLYDLQGLEFIKNVDAKNVVIDELVWRETNQVLRRNPNWRNVTVTAPSPGQFVLTGYLATRQQADELASYVSANFDYIDRLERRIIVEEEIVSQAEIKLRNLDMPNIEVGLSDGDLSLTGQLSPARAATLREQISEFDSIPGVRNVRLFITEVERDTALIDLTDRYNVTGYSDRGGGNIHVIINGRIITVGDSIDGLTVTSITPDVVLLERDGTRYRINIR